MTIDRPEHRPIADATPVGVSSMGITRNFEIAGFID